MTHLTESEILADRELLVQALADAFGVSPFDVPHAKLVEIKMSVCMLHRVRRATRRLLESIDHD